MIVHHDENRRWLVESLDGLDAFVKHDPDYFGDRAYESKAIMYQRKFVSEGKYQVVFLGAFNVGKSTGINAFLGGAYLPMDIEECTSRLTFIQRGEDLRLVLALDTPASPHEISALERALADLGATIETARSNHELTVRCPSHEPEMMRRALEPLVTVSADDDFPHLAPLREKTEALTLYLPSDALEDDIVFVDTPGVHSISETRQKITYGIIEHSHLVIVFVDSAFVGNIHDLKFIKRIITCRGRRVFFVLNKADKLENEEIDPRGTHGPAAQLIETFRRHDIPEDSDIFFLSGYRALRALELDQQQRTLAEALDDNRLLIPTPVVERIIHSADPTRDLSAYLMGQSRFPHLKERLLDYLLNENKTSAVFELAARFLYERGSDCLISVRNALALAREPSKFEELRANRERLQTRIAEIRELVNAAVARYRARCRGGQVDGTTESGYVARMRAMLTEPEIEKRVIEPTIAWLRADGHLKQARHEKFQPLSAQLEHQLDEYVSAILADLGRLIETNESETSTAIAEQIGAARTLRERMTEPGVMRRATVAESVSGEYMAFGTGGAVVGAMTGAIVVSVVPVIGTAIGAGLGGLLGAVFGFLVRLAWSEERWIRKLTPAVRKNAMDILVHGAADGATPVVQGLTDYLNKRADVFEETLEGEINSAVDAVQREYDALLVREEEIRRERDAIIERLEPKEAMLEEIRGGARALLAQPCREDSGLEDGESPDLPGN